MQREHGNIASAVSVANYLSLYMGQEQGVRLGESSVISRKAHSRMPEKRIKGQIKVLTNRDAGKSYLDYIESDQVVHIDVYHKDGEIDPVDLSRVIFWSIDQHLLEEEPRLLYAEDERFNIVSAYVKRLYIVTRIGKGVVYELFQNEVKAYQQGEEGWDHVHMLARLNRDEYVLIYIIVEAIEEFILASGVQLARVRNISHGKEKQLEEDFSAYIKLPWKKFKGQKTNIMPERENVNQLILKLAEKFGGVEEIQDFMECYSTNIFKRKGSNYQSKKWGDVEHYVEQMEELGLMKDSLTGRKLSKKGMKLQKYIIQHQCELETEIRRNIRKVPGSGSSKFKKMGQVNQKNRRVEFINYNKTININSQQWSGNLAVPETIIQAKKNSFFREDKRFSIQKEDLHYYAKRSYIPVDICLLMDASGSMAGEKRQAAAYLAQHLLLSGKERVAVVSFQEHDSRVVVPFTRNQKMLSKGLATISPAGLTPMAAGIMTALNLISNSRVRNPLLVMITDGIPNTPLWTTDARADGIHAAALLKENDINSVCIGVESNRIYLEKLCKSSGGTLYLVDDLNRDNLINIVRIEKKNMLKSHIS